MNHHGRKVIRTHHELTAIVEVNLAIPLDPFEAAAENGELRRLFWFNDGNVIEIYGILLGEFVNDLTASKQNGYAELALVKKLSSLYYTRHLAIRKNNTLRMSPDFFKN